MRAQQDFHSRTVRHLLRDLDHFDGESAETAARMLDRLEQSGRRRLARQAVIVVSMPPEPS